MERRRFDQNVACKEMRDRGFRIRSSKRAFGKQPSSDDEAGLAQERRSTRQRIIRRRFDAREKPLSRGLESPCAIIEDRADFRQSGRIRRLQLRRGLLDFGDDGVKRYKDTFAGFLICSLRLRSCAD